MPRPKSVLLPPRSVEYDSAPVDVSLVTNASQPPFAEVSYAPAVVGNPGGEVVPVT